MKDFIKRMALSGIGFASLGKEKLETMAKDIANNLGISEEEGRKVAEEILDETRKAREDVQKNTKETVHSALNNMDIPSRSDVENLEQRLKSLEDKIDALNTKE